MVISNHLGAAAWHGKADMVEQLLKLGKQGLDQLSVEEADKRAKNQLQFQREYFGYSPLMLAVAREEKDK